MRVAALVLAAGTASRYRAAAPEVATKLVVSYRGRPVVRHVVEAAVASRARPLVVVTGHAAEEVEAAIRGIDLTLRHNPDYATGLASSLKTGLAALPPETSGVLVLLGDMPDVTPALLERLIAAFMAKPDVEAVVPVVGGRRGNPALLGRALFDEAARLPGDEGARRLLARARVAEIEVEDVGVLLDIDEPVR